MSRMLRARLHEDVDVAVMWRRRVAGFTHDWLRNRFLPRVHGLIAIAGAEAGVRRSLMETLIAEIREWEARGAEALMLADEYVEVMSPHRVVGDVALRLAPDVADFLRRSAAACWSARNRICSRLVQVRNAHARMDAQFRDWNDASAGAHEAVVALNGMASECEALIAALCSLPTKVRF